MGDSSNSNHHQCLVVEWQPDIWKHWLFRWKLQRAVELRFVYINNNMFLCASDCSALSPAACGACLFFSSLSLNFIYFASLPALLSQLCTKAANLHNVTHWQWRGYCWWQPVCRTSWKVCRQIQYCFTSQETLTVPLLVSFAQHAPLLVFLSTSLAFLTQFTFFQWMSPKFSEKNRQSACPIILCVAHSAPISFLCCSVTFTHHT